MLNLGRFSIIYIAYNQYCQINCASSFDVKARLQELVIDEHIEFLGVYDAKTELFQWEPIRQHYYDQLSIEEQGHLGSQLIEIAKRLRQQQQQRTIPGLAQSPLYSGFINSL
jgi:hypothetical protein